MTTREENFCNFAKTRDKRANRRQTLINKGYTLYIYNVTIACQSRDNTGDCHVR